MSNCSGFPTTQDAKDFATDSKVFKEVVTSQESLTPSTATDGLQKKTLKAFGDDFDNQLTNQANQFDSSMSGWSTQIDSQYIYKNGGDWADAPAQITDADKLTYWMFTDGSGYAVKGSVTLPITKPASPVNDNNWFVATSVNLHQMRTDSASQLGYVYVGEYTNNMDVDSGSMTDKKCWWYNGKFITPTTDNAFNTGVIFNNTLWISRYINTDLKPFESLHDAVLFLQSYPLTDGLVSRWDGYWKQSDGGSGWGVIKSGNVIGDGGSQIKINDQFYIEQNLKNRVSILKFGAKNDFDVTTRTGTDNYTSMYNCLYFVASQTDVSTMYIPDGKFMHSTIELDNLPLNNSDGTDNKRSLQIIGNNQFRSQLWLKKGDTAHFYESFDVTQTRGYRAVVMSNFACFNADPGDVTNPNNPLYASGGLQLFNNPYSRYSNLYFEGMKRAAHVRTCWLSEFKNIVSRISGTTLFIDGDDGKGGYGYAQQVTAKRIVGGGLSLYPKEYHACVYVRGSHDQYLQNINCEFKKTPAVLVQGANNTRVVNLHIEGSSSDYPIRLAPIDGDGWKTDITEWCIGFSLDGGTVGTSSIDAVVGVAQGVSNVSVKNISSKPRTGSDSGSDDSIQLVKLIRVPNAQDALHSCFGISCWDNNNTFQEIDYLSVSSPYLQAFTWGGNVVIESGSNYKFYGATIKQGDTLLVKGSGEVYQALTTGTFGRALTQTCSTVAGSRFVTMTDFTDIDVNTYINFGSERRHVCVVDTANNRVEVNYSLSATQSNVAIEYAEPQLIQIK